MFLKSSTLASLRFFEAAARLLSFKQAAVELHVTQGAVSHQIKHLEDALRCKLFHRLPRQIRLTTEGERFFSVVQRALLAIDNEALAITRASPRRDIRVRAGPSFALRWLVPRLGKFYPQHPEINLYVSGAYGAFDLTRRDFDLAIERAKRKLPGLQSEPLMDEYLIPVCSPEYLAKRPFLKAPALLNRCTLLHDSEPWSGATRDAEWRHWLKAVGAAQVDSSKGQFFSLANMAIEAALNDQGVAMGRAALVQESVARGHLVTPFKRRVRSPASYWLAYPSELRESPQMKLVIGWLREQAGGV
jgi:LysR family transcriptional regulator, glycine cleavage system transcriptional activator